MSNNISICTAFFDIGRSTWTPDKGFPHYLHRSVETYIERFTYLLQLETDIVVFTSLDLVDKLKSISSDRKYKTTVIPIDLSDYSDIKAQIIEIQNDSRFLDKININQIKNPEYWNPDYVLVTNLKAYFVALAIEQNLVKEDMVAWIDFGYCRSASNIPNSKTWKYNFDPEKIHLFSYKPYDGTPILEIIANNDVYILGAKVIAHKNLWSILNKLMIDSRNQLFEQNFVDDDQGLWLISSLRSPELFELHTIPDHQLGYDPFVLFNQFNLINE